MLYVSTKFNYTSQVEYKLQQSRIQVTTEQNTSYNRAQYKLQQSTIQVTTEHNTSYNRAQYKLQQHNTSCNRAQYKFPVPVQLMDIFEIDIPL